MKYLKTVLVFCFALMGLVGFAQIDTLTPPFKKFPTLPPLQLILADSLTKYTKADLPKKKPLLVMLFSPDCEHCGHEAESFASNAEALKKIQIVMVTTYPLYRVKDFAEKYGLDKMKNVVVAKDPHYLLIPFYDVRNFPFLALYNKKGKLIQTLSGAAGVNKLLEAFQQAE